jgi:membrane-associated protease RseP (regulator of RpoE activity)
MNLKNALYLIISLLLTGGIVLAQQPRPAPPTGAPPPAELPAMPGEPPAAFSFFIEGGSFLGIYAEDVNKENMGRYGLREARGVAITQVVKDSPAEKAGLKKDDVILKFEGDSVTSVRKLNRLVSEVAPDQTARLAISRGGVEQEVTVTVGKRNVSSNTFHRWQGLEGLKGLEELRGVMPPDAPGAPGANVWKWEGQGPGGEGMIFSFGNNRRIGATTMQLTKQLADYFGVADGKGVLVTSVTDDSPAAKAGLKAGDVITSVDGEKVEGAGDLSRAINKKKDGDVTLTVIRNRSQQTITVTPKAAFPPGRPGAIPQAGRRIVIPRVELGSIPEMNIVIPQIDLPIIPQINVQLPGKMKAPKVRVIRDPEQPI